MVLACAQHARFIYRLISGFVEALTVKAEVVEALIVETKICFLTENWQ